VVVSGSQKAFMAPPGIAFAGISSRAWNMVERSRLPKLYWSYQKSKDAYNKPIPQNPFTPPVSILVAFNKALKMVEKECMENMWSRHRLLAEATRAGLKAMGLKLFAKGGWGNGVTSVLPPEGVDGGKIVRMMREEFGITIAGGQGDLKGKIFRIGHLGYVDRLDIILTLAALEMTLARLGVEVELGSGVRGTQEVFLKAEG
ncbi:pyridoxal-phosphate-dependent aminotransferase family protein, partial [Candidatus Hakubella thermalkaliphila]